MATSLNWLHTFQQHNSEPLINITALTLLCTTVT